MKVLSSLRCRLTPCRFFTAVHARKLATVHKSASAQYEEAIAALNSLQTNQSSLAGNRRAGKTIDDILGYLSCVNVQLDDLDRLNIIHVAGTKGKGSTCAFTESILRQYGYRTGFYSSPHLIEVRERIRINGDLLSKEKFVQYFWQCYNPIRDAVQKSNGEDALPMPFYFAFLTTMMFYVFVHEQIDTAIIEVGIGGEYDCTNVIRTPIVCGVASLGLDHVSVLGNTIDKIAWQKAGIFKRGVPAVTSPQLPEAMRVLEERAEEKQCTLMVTPSLNHYANYPFPLGLNGDIQETNAALAIQLAMHWLAARGGSDQSYEKLMTSPLSPEMLQGLATCRWSGRNEIIETNSATFYVDGAHTIESIEQCKTWFLNIASQRQPSGKRILLFYCSKDRNPELLLQSLIGCKFDSIAFCSPTASLPTSGGADHPSPADSKPNQWRATKTIDDEINRLALHVGAFEKLWQSTIENQTNMPAVHSFQSVSQALTWIGEGKCSKPAVLVTGSLYLVGALLKVLEQESPSL